MNGDCSPRVGSSHRRIRVARATAATALPYRTAGPLSVAMTSPLGAGPPPRGCPAALTPDRDGRHPPYYRTSPRFLQPQRNGDPDRVGGPTLRGSVSFISRSSVAARHGRPIKPGGRSDAA